MTVVAFNDKDHCESTP